MTSQLYIVDAWMQHPTKRFAEQPMFNSLRRWMGPGSIDAIPVDFTVASMDAANVRTGVLAAWCGPQGWLITNEEVSEIVSAHPDRFVAAASANLFRPLEAVRELRRCVKQLGFKALRIVPWLWDLPPDDRRYYPLYAECCELNIPFLTQVGHTGPLCPSEPGRPIPYLDRVALEFPELTIVAGHIGYPWLDEMISLATKYPNVYIDTSAYKASRYPRPFVEYMSGRGRKKVLFGTNFPMLTHAQALEGVDLLELDEETRGLFLRGNAERVFKLTA